MIAFDLLGGRDKAEIAACKLTGIKVRVDPESCCQLSWIREDTGEGSRMIHVGSNAGMLSLRSSLLGCSSFSGEQKLFAESASHWNMDALGLSFRASR